MMDSDEEEMLYALMEEGADAAAADEEHLLILACLAGLYPVDATGITSSGLCMACESLKTTSFARRIAPT